MNFRFHIFWVLAFLIQLNALAGENPAPSFVLNPGVYGIPAAEFGDHVFLGKSVVIVHEKTGQGTLHVFDRNTGAKFATILPPHRAYDYPSFGTVAGQVGNFLFASSPHTYNPKPHDGKGYMFANIQAGGAFNKVFDWGSGQTAGYLGSYGAASADTVVLSQGINAQYSSPGFLKFYKFDLATGAATLFYTHPKTSLGKTAIANDRVLSMCGDAACSVQVFNVSRDANAAPTSVQLAQTVPLPGVSTSLRRELDLLATDGDYFAVGNYGAAVTSGSSNLLAAGSVDIFVYQNGAFAYRESVKAPVPSANARFGFSVAIANGTLFVGAPGEPGNAAVADGAAYAFELSGGARYLGRFSAPERKFGSSEAFGSSMCADSSTLVIGASKGAEDSLGVTSAGSGSVYVYGVGPLRRTLLNNAEGFILNPPSAVVGSTTFSQRADGSRLVDIRYTLTGGTTSVALGVSLDGGTTFTSVKTLTGDVGAAVTAGTAKHIVWNAGADYPNLNAPSLKVRVTPLLDGAGGSFTPIPGGTYQMGNLSGDADITNAGTVAVTLSPYYMAVGPTTKAQWDTVRTWAAANGYTDLAPGEGKAADHPVQRVSWYDALKWANAASEKEGLTPCYKVGATVVRTGTSDTVSCDWTANGYRLPTEAEWEIGARGGLNGKRFPWGDTISHSQANYKAGPGFAYDLSAAVKDHHPAHKNGLAPYTNAAGSFAANGYGLYDMAGNVWQWCWDRFETPYAGGEDPRGGTSGWFRVFRGGLWYHHVSMARSAGRYGDQPGFGNNSLGFRLVRGRSSGLGGWTESVAGVVDTVPPVLSLTGPVSVTSMSASGAVVTLSGASATDNLGTPVLTYSPASGSTFPVGTTTVTVTATDSVGNKTSRTFTVTVAPPTANILGAGGTLALIPGGTYQMGNLTGDSDITDVGTISVTLSPYYMAVHHTTKTQWDTIRAWASANGYTDMAAGVGKASNHPVQSMSWYDVVKWANAASEKEGLTPCYKVSGAVYRTGTSDAVTCDWSANGYRLPTEAEWEVAARGGLSGKRFPWGDTISQSQANYHAFTRYAYDLSGSVNDYHPTYKTGGFPYVSPVGSFAANGYGLYDMAGNVGQWCWDWYGTPYAGGTDPRGAGTGSWRVMRGGYSIYYADALRIACRDHYIPAEAGHNGGFRLVRGRL